MGACVCGPGCCSPRRPISCAADRRFQPRIRATMQDCVIADKNGFGPVVLRARASSFIRDELCLDLDRACYRSGPTLSSMPARSTMSGVAVMKSSASTQRITSPSVPPAVSLAIYRDHIPDGK